MMMADDITYIDLFAGCGGMSLGLERAGFKCVLALDNNLKAIETFNLNRKERVGRVVDMNDLPPARIGEMVGRDVCLVAGGPPCQGYSMAGRRNIMDPRNSLVDRFLDVVGVIKPPYFLMENVPGILSMLRPDGVLVVKHLVKRARSLGYHARFKKLFAHHYGVPQARPRVFLIGNRDGCPVPSFPARTHFESGGRDLFGNRVKRHVTVGQAFASIPDDAPNRETVYDLKRPDYIARVEKLGPGESVYQHFKESHRRLDPNKPSFTMKFNHGAIALHTKETRMVNLREMAMIQNFDPYYEFVGDTNEKIAEMIGNAVPPGLSAAVGGEIMKCVMKNLDR